MELHSKVGGLVFQPLPSCRTGFWDEDGPMAPMNPTITVVAANEASWEDLQAILSKTRCCAGCASAID
jgi:hypothetical protein